MNYSLFLPNGGHFLQRNFVANELFVGEITPPQTRRRFHPSDKDLRNFMSKAKSQQANSKVSQPADCFIRSTNLIKGIYLMYM